MWLLRAASCPYVRPPIGRRPANPGGRPPERALCRCRCRCAALDAHRSAIFHRARLALAEADTEHQLEAQTKSHDTRAAITAPHIRLQILVPELAGPAQLAADATYVLRKAADRSELDARRHAAKEASVAFIAAAAALLSPDHR